MENFNTAMTRQFNLEMIVLTLRDLKPRTRKKLADETGLSIATCGNILSDLLKQGQVNEFDLAETNGGRPAQYYVYNPNHILIAGIFVIYHEKVITLNYFVSNLIGDLIEGGSIESACFEAKSIEELADQIITRHQIIRSLAIGVPGIVKEGVIIDCDIPELIGCPLEDKIKSKYNIKVIIENDMNLVALGLFQKLEHSMPNIIVAINFPKDSCGGSGIVIDGEILRGFTNFAGEISYLPFGVSRNNMIEFMNQPTSGLDAIIRTIASVIALINPSTIALTGELAQNNLLQEIIDGISLIIHAKHLPQIIIRDDIKDDYINGLIYVTLKSLSFTVAQTTNMNELVSANIRKTTLAKNSGVK